MKTPVIAAAMLLMALCGCDSRAPTPGPARPSPTPAPASSAPPGPTDMPVPSLAGKAPRTVNFVELQTGDCVADLPPSDLSSVTVNVVDCAGPHLAEVVARRGIEVNTALDDVAGRACAAGFSAYTGRTGTQPFSLTYLIDSNQDRTSDNPLPSTVICLAQSGDGSALNGSLRH